MIPEHTKCINCGECCGSLIPISKTEDKVIEEYVSNMDIFTKQRLRTQKRDSMTCQFRDNLKRNCAIYPARPIICKLFGVTKDLKCPQGNTCKINGYELLGDEPRYLMPWYL